MTNKRTILIIDDSFTDRAVYHRFLRRDKRYNYEITEIEYGKKVLEIYEQIMPDLVLLDYILPDSDGLEILNQLKLQTRSNQLPVVMLTGQGDETIAVEAIRLGAQDYLVKDKLTAKTFYRTIDAAIERVRLLEQLEQQQEQQRLVNSLALHIRQSLHLEEILKTATADVRESLKADRVVIYQFAPDMKGTIVAESVLPQWSTCLNVEIEDTCFQENSGDKYQYGQSLAIPNIYQANLSDCHIELLEQFQVKAKLVVPIVLNTPAIETQTSKDNQAHSTSLSCYLSVSPSPHLWGLLIVHQCSSPRQWHSFELELLQQLAVQLEIAIQQAKLYQNLELRVTQRTAELKEINERLNFELFERRQAQQRLEEQAQLLDLARDTILTRAPDGVITFWNKGAEQMYGWTEEEALGETSYELLQTQFPQPSIEIEKELLERGYWEGQLTHTRRDGTAVITASRWVLRRDSNNRPIGVLEINNDITQQKYLKSALRESEERFHNAFHNAAIGKAIVGLDGHWLEVNRSLCEMLGYSEEELLAIDFQKITHSEDLNTDLDYAHQLLSGQLRYYHMEKRYIHKLGHVVWGLLSGSLVRDAQGQPLYFIAEVQDISDRRHAEESLRQFERIVSATTDGIALLNPNYIYQVVNKAYLSWWNKSDREILGHSVSDIVGEAPFEQTIKPKLDRCFAGETVQYEMWVDYPYLGRHFLSVTYAPYFDADQRISGVVVSLRNLTELKQAEEALRLSEQRLQLAFEGSGDGLWDWNVKTGEAYHSARYMKILGYAPDEFANNVNSWKELIHPDDRAQVLQLLEAHLKDSSVRYFIDYRMRTKSGEWKWITDYGKVVGRDQNDQPLRMTGTLRDINHRKQAEIALQESEERFRAIFNQTFQFVGLLTPDGVLLEANQTALDFGGFTREQAVGNKFWEARWWTLSTEIQQQLKAAIARAAQGEFIRYEVDVLGKDRIATIDFSLRPIFDDAGQVKLLIPEGRDITDRKLLEQELVHKQQLLDAFITSAPVGMTVLDEQLHYTLVNKALAEINGIPAPDHIGKTPWEIVPDLAPKQRENFYQVLDTKKPILFFEITGETPKFPGISRTWLVSYFPILQSQVHQTMGIGMVVVEITERKRAEEALRESEERWQLALRGNNDGLWDWNVKTNQVFFSARWKEMLGYEEHEIENHLDEWAKRVHPDELDWVNQTIEDHFAKKTPFYMTEHRVLCKDNSYKWILDRGQACWDETGNVVRMIGSHTDISERKRMEEALYQSQQRLQYLLNSSPAVIFSCKSDGDYSATYMSDNVKKVLGYEPGDFINKSDFWYSHVHPDDIQQIITLFQQDFHAHEYRFLHADGTYRWLRVEMKVPKDEAGNITEIVGYLVDISDRKASEEALRHSESTLRSFFNSASMLMGIVELHDTDIFQISANQAAANFFGTTSEAQQNRFVGNDMGMPQAHLQKWIEYYREADRTQAPVRFEYAQETPTGQHWLAAIVCRIPGSDRHPKFSYIVEDITERKQIEEALSQSEEQRRLAIDLTHIGLWDLHLPTGKLIWNDNHFTLLGLIPGTFEPTVEIWSERIYPEDQNRTKQAFFNSLKARIDYEVEYRVIHPNGNIRWMLSRGRAVYDESGNPVRSLGVILDISDRKQIEQAIQASETRYRAIVEDQTELISRFLPDSTILFVNEAYCRYFRLKSDEIIGKSYSPAVFEEDRERIAQMLQSMSRENPTAIIENRVIVGEEIRWTQWINRMLFDEQGHFIEYQSVGRDITDRKLAELALQEQKEWLVKAQRVAHIGNWTLDVATEKLNWSEELFHIFGFDPANPEPAYAENLKNIHPEDVPLLQQCIERTMTEGIPYEIDLRIIRADGSTGYLEGRGEAVRDEQGKIIRVFGTAMDISDRKLAELELKQAKEAAEVANQAKSIFLANMSHELRTPLNVILGFTQVMNRDPALTLEHQENLRTIHRSGDHLLGLINDILDLAKIEAGRMTLDENSFDLPALLYSIGDMFRQRAKTKNLLLHLDLAPDLPQFVRIDANKLRQVLINLLGNAIKFTDRGSVTLRVSLAQRQHLTNEKEHRMANNRPLTLLFEVEDTGIGIAPKDLSAIFNAFVQTQAHRTSLEGTGLGLTITRRFVELMGGQIRVNSTLDQGSTFAVEIPIHLATASEVTSDQISRRVIGLAANQPAYRILVVDDQPDNRQLLVKLLAQVGLEAQEATNGEEAVQLWQQWHPDLIWMDVRMPGIDGYEATQQIRAYPEGQKTVIIALTAQASESDQTLALSAGCTDFLRKPFRGEDLFAKMERHLGLQFNYLEDDTNNLGDKEQENSLNSAALTFESLLVMELSWVNQFHQAAWHCDDEEIFQLIQQIPKEHAFLIAGLNHLAHNYDFRKLMELTQSALNSFS